MSVTEDERMLSVKEQERKDADDAVAYPIAVFFLFVGIFGCAGLLLFLLRKIL